MSGLSGSGEMSDIEELKLTIELHCAICGEAADSKKRCKNCGVPVEKLYTAHHEDKTTAKLVVGPAWEPGG